MRNMKNYTNCGYLYIRKYSPYVDGIIGVDIKLTLKQKIQILFCKGISVCIGNVFKKEGAGNGK